MEKYEVYKKIRKKATIMGMPANNFTIMVVFDALFILILSTGYGLVKILIVLFGCIVSFILARFTFNNINPNPNKIEDYKRN